MTSSETLDPVGPEDSSFLFFFLNFIYLFLLKLVRTLNFCHFSEES